MSETTRKILPCDCGWHQHSLSVEIIEDGMIEVGIQVALRDDSLWQRVKSAWRVLKGDDHLLHEIVLAREEAIELGEYVRASYE